MNRWFNSLRCVLTDWRSLVVVATATSGCAYHDLYPEKWAPIVNDPALCTHINGDYTPYDYGSRFVISWVAGNATPKPPAKVLDADRLSLKILGKTLTATAYLGGTIISEKQYHIQCGGDSLVLDLGGKFEAGEGTVGYDTTLFRLRKDSTGSIVVKEESSGVAAYGPIPFAGSSSVWVGRFLPYDPNAIIPQKPIERPQTCTYNVSQILVDTREEAEKVEKALDDGESFEQLAATNNRFFCGLKMGC